MKKNHRFICQSSIAALLLGTFSFPSAVSAATLNWDGEAGDNLWATAINWFDGSNNTNDVLPAATVPGDDLVFGTTGATIDLGGNRVANSLSFTSTGFQLGLTSTTNTLNVATGNISVSAGTSQISAILAGSNGLTKTGAGTLVLANTANTFTGPIVVNGPGVLAYTGQGNADPTALGAGAKTITLTNGGTLRPLTASDPNSGGGKAFVIGTGGGTIDIPTGASLILNDANQFQGAGTLTKTGPGILTLGQSSTGYSPGRTGDTIISEGTILVGHANGLGVSTSTVTLKANGALGTLNNAVTIPNPITVTEAGNTAGAGQIVAQGNNTLIGGTLTLNADTVFNTADYNSGALTSGTTSGTSRIIFTSGIVTGSGNLIVNGPSGGTRGVLTLNNTSDDFTGSITINKGVSVENFARFSGSSLTVANAGKTISSAKIIFGAGGTNTATPQLDLRDNGTGAIGTVFNYGNDVDATANGGNIVVSNGSVAAGSGLSGKFQLGSLAIGAQTLTTSGSQNYSVEFTGATTLSGNATISPGSTGTSSTSDLTLSGPVSGGFNLTKGGSGILTLSGTNTFGGAGKSVSVSGGILSVTSDAALGDTQNVVNVSGGSLRTAGTFASARTININGTATAGSSSSASTSTGANGSLDVPLGNTLTLSSAITTASTGSVPTFGKTNAGTLASTVTSGTPFGTGNITLSGGTLFLQPSGAGNDVSLTGANSGAISRIAISGGTNYTAAPTATVTSPTTGVTTAIATTVSSGAVNASITDIGSGYTSLPTITLTGGTTTGTAATITAAALNLFTYDKGVAVRLDKGGNNSLTYTVGVANSPANTTLFRAATGSTLTLVPSAGANLGTTEKFIVNGGVAMTNNTVSPSIVAVNSPTDSTASFVTHSTANGFATAAAVTDINTAATTANVTVSSAATLSASRTINALRVDNVALSGAAGTTLTLNAVANPSFTGSQAGIILNGGSVTVPAITPASNAETMIYTSAANGSITSFISGTGGTTKFGPGTLTFAGALPSGTLNITEGTFALGSLNAINGQAVQLNTAGAVLDLHGFSQTTGNFTTSVPAGTYPLVTTTGGAATLTISPTGASTFSGLLADGAGSPLSILKTGGQQETFNTINTYSGGTTVAGGTLTVSGSGTLGTGDVLVTNSGKLDISNMAAVNNRGGATVTLTAVDGAVPVLIMNGTSFQQPITSSSNGVIAINVSFSATNVLAGNSSFLGANSAQTYSAGSLAVGTGNTYRLGGGGSTLTLSGANVVTGANQLVVGVPASAGGAATANGTGTVSLQAAQNFTGATTINAGSTLELKGTSSAAGGTALSSTGFTVNGGSLVLNNDVGTNVSAGNSSNRIADTAPVVLSQGTLQLQGPNVTAAGTNVTEQIGQLTFQKGSTVKVNIQGGASLAILKAASLGARNTGDTLSLLTQSAGQLTGTSSSVSQFIISGTAPAVTANGGSGSGIVAPYIVNATDNTFVTHGANGFANATYSSAALSDATNNDVVNVSAATALSADASAYALRLGASALTGTNNVALVSGGLILNNTGTAAVTHTPDFVFGSTAAPAEALLYASGAQSTVLSGTVTANALTKFGSGTVNLISNVKTSMPDDVLVNVNAGTLQFGEDNKTADNTPVPTNARVVVNSGATAQFFTSATIGSLTGAGTVKVGNSLSGQNARTLTVNTQTNDVFGGTLTIGGTSGQVAFTKGGSGTLTFNNASLTTIRDLAINSGSVVFNGSTAMTNQTNRNRVQVNQGAVFTIDNSSNNQTDRLKLDVSNNAGGMFNLTGGTFNYIGNSTAPSSEQMGIIGGNSLVPNPLVFGAGADTINIQAGTGQPAVLSYRAGDATGANTVTNDNNSVAFVRNTGASVLIKGTNLGGKQGDANVASVLFSVKAPTLTGANSGAGTGAQTGILKGVIANSVIDGSDTYGLATYDRGANGLVGDGDDAGIRRLTASELSSTITSGDTTVLNNVRLSSAATITADSAVNALHLSGGNVDSTNATLTINSGTLLSANNGATRANSINGGTLAFSGGEAIIHAESDLSIGSAITGTTALTKGGPATLTLSNTANTFTGNVVVNGGLVAVSANAQLGAVANNITLNNGGGIKATGTFTLDNAGANKRGITLGAAGGRVDVADGETVTVSGTISGGLGASVLAGGISGTTGARFDSSTVFTKTGSGTLELTGANTFTGRVEVNGGTLLVGNSAGAGSLGANAYVAVNDGGTLGGSGTITGGVTLNVGGTVQPGNSPGKLNTGDFTFNGGTLSIEISGEPTGGNYDQLNVTGSVSLAANTPLVLTLGTFVPADNGTMSFTIVNNDGTDAISGVGRFVSGNQVLNEGAVFTSSGQTWSISYAGGTGNDVVITSVPEPGSLVTLFGGVGCLLGLQRFRRRSARS